jgi:ArsR family transcriptional regulator
MFGIARFSRVEGAIAAGHHPRNDCGDWRRVLHEGLLFMPARPAHYRQILILVNIDVDRYDPPMTRPKTKLVDPDVRLFAALADPTRLAIVRELAAQEVCACDLTSCCDVRQPTVSHHLKVLREAGVVEAERRGTWIWYRLAPAAADRLRSLAGELSGTPQLIPASSLRRSPAAVRPQA